MVPGFYLKYVCHFWVQNVKLVKIWPRQVNGLKKTNLEPNFGVSSSQNKNFGQQCNYQKVWKIALSMSIWLDCLHAIYKSQMKRDIHWHNTMMVYIWKFNHFIKMFPNQFYERSAIPGVQENKWALLFVMYITVGTWHIYSIDTDDHFLSVSVCTP